MPLHLTDRSRYIEGMQHCRRARWQHYHAGPYGLGYQLKARALPLTTGTYTHLPITELLALCIGQASSFMPTKEKVRAAVKSAQDKYRKLIEKRGIIGVSVNGEYVVEEQCALVEGFAWGFYRVVLPGLLKEWRVVAVEQSFPFLIGCTCGLTDTVGAIKDHEARGCNGKIVQSKPDVLLQSLASGSHSYLELKTSGDLGFKWRQQFEDNVQVAFGAEGAERNLGVRIESFHVLGLEKGQRRGDWDPDTGGYQDEAAIDEGLKKQNSPLIYGYYSPGSPPFMQEKWAASREYYDDNPGKYSKGKAPGPRGYRHTLTKDFSKVPIWAQGEDMTVEKWVLEVMPEEVVRKQFELLGPIPRPVWLMDRVFKQVALVEQEWVETLHKLWVKLQECGGDEAHPEFQAELDRLVPQSWKCYDYKSNCPMKHLCFQKEGWERPLETGKYETRRPHHEIELERALKVGAPVAEEEEARE